VTKRPDAPHEAPRQLHLTRIEWAILELLLRNPGRLVPGSDLLQHVWGPTATPPLGHLRFHLAKLRKKLEPEPSHPRQLITAPGAGYLFQP
jgi:two-component system KDP operon response regulator KdpE